MTRKNYFIIVVVQFRLAGRTDPGNKVGSWGPWTKAPITSIALAYPGEFLVLILQSSMPHKFSPACFFFL